MDKEKNLTSLIIHGNQIDAFEYLIGLVLNYYICFKYFCRTNYAWWLYDIVHSGNDSGKGIRLLKFGGICWKYLLFNVSIRYCRCFQFMGCITTWNCTKWSLILNNWKRLHIANNSLGVYETLIGYVHTNIFLKPVSMVLS